MSKLALFGGPQAVTIPQPHFRWPLIGQEEVDAVTNQLLHGEISIYGRKGVIAEFEDVFCSYQGTKYAIMMNTGTAALYAAFFSIGIGPGDEVIAPSYTFHATVTPVLHCHGMPVLCDSEADTGNIAPGDIEKRISERTKAVVVTHIWGHPCEMDEIMRIVRKHDLYLVEDCSHAHGATYKGQKVGTFGDVAVFSLQANKIVAAGEGGILITNDQTIYERATLVSDYRKRPAQEVKSEFYRRFVDTGYGLKLRAHPLAAALAFVQYRHLEERIAARHDNLMYLSEKLAEVPGIEPPVTRPYVHRGAWYGYKPLLRAEELGGISRDRYIEALQAEGVDIHEPGSKPLHLLPLFQSAENWPFPLSPTHDNFARFIHNEGDLPVCEEYYSRALSLPTFTEPSRNIIDQYADAFAKVAMYHQDLL